jgi:hypothetical protein
MPSPPLFVLSQRSLTLCLPLVRSTGGSGGSGGGGSGGSGGSGGRGSGGWNDNPPGGSGGSGSRPWYTDPTYWLGLLLGGALIVPAYNAIFKKSDADKVSGVMRLGLWELGCKWPCGGEG